MKTGFACPACQAPLVLRYLARGPEGARVKRSLPKCPNPFCRAELPSRRAEMDLAYALVRTAGAEEIDQR